MPAGGALIHDMALGERPRERLLRLGCRALSDAELLAVLLRSGRPGSSALEMAGDILRQTGGLLGLAAASERSLRRPGLGPAKASSLLAAVELGRRLARAQMPERRLLARPAEVATYLSLRYASRDQEVMGALYLDVRHRFLAEKELYRGTLDRAAVEPREILKEGLLQGAASLVLFHTHPSGDPSPSLEDLLFTRRLAEAGEVLGVQLLDHLILGHGGRWLSLKQERGW